MLRRERPSAPRSRWGLARRLVLLQVGLVLLACLIAVGVSVWQARKGVTDQAGRRCLSIAEALASTQWVADQIRTPNPTATLEPFAVRVQDDTGVDFITIMNDRGIRLTHPDLAQIGKPYLGTTAPALAGGIVVETYTGTLGPSVRAAVPIRSAAGGPIIALVAVGVRVDALGPEIASKVTIIAALGGALLLLALAGTWLIGRRLDRQTHGLGAAELGLMHTYYDAVLHSVREGLVLLDHSGRIRLMNAEARRLLDITGDPVGLPVAALDLPAGVAQAMSGTEHLVDSVQLAHDRVLVVSALTAVTPAKSAARSTAVGRVITLRDHTELSELASELGVARDLTEALRSQAHESANRLHAVITLVELGRTGEAVEFATEELRVAQLLTDQVVDAIAEPVIAAVLLGKAQVAAERGIEFEITADSALDADTLADVGLTSGEIVTVLGNLIDNALEAVSRQPPPAPRQVRVTVRRSDPDADELLVQVADTGPGLDAVAAEQAFRRGWSTKQDDGAVHGHGLGLGLVGQVVHRHGGRISVDGGHGAVFRVQIGGGAVPVGGHPEAAASYSRGHR